MNEYKERARQKFALHAQIENEKAVKKLEETRLQKHVEETLQQKQAEEARLQKEEEEARLRKDEEEARQRKEQHNNEWDNICSVITEDRVLHLHTLFTLLEAILPQYTDKSHWQEKVISLIQNLNEIQIQQNQTFKDLEEIRLIAQIMDNMCVLAEVDIEIEQMDTSEDETIAMKMAELWRLDIISEMRRDRL